MNQARLPAKKTLRARRAGPAAAPRRGRAGAKKAGDVKKTKAAGMATRYAQPQLLPAAQQPAPVPLMPPPAAAPTARDRLPAAPPKKTNAKRAPPAAYVPNQNYNQPVNLGVARATHETYDAVNAPPINPYATAATSSSYYGDEGGVAEDYYYEEPGRRPARARNARNNNAARINNAGNSNHPASPARDYPAPHADTELTATYKYRRSQPINTLGALELVAELQRYQSVDQPPPTTDVIQYILLAASYGEYIAIESAPGQKEAAMSGFLPLDQAAVPVFEPLSILAGGDVNGVPPLMQEHGLLNITAITSLDILPFDLDPGDLRTTPLQYDKRVAKTFAKGFYAVYYLVLQSGASYSYIQATGTMRSHTIAKPSSFDYGPCGALCGISIGLYYNTMDYDAIRQMIVAALAACSVVDNHPISQLAAIQVAFFTVFAVQQVNIQLWGRIFYQLIVRLARLVIGEARIANVIDQWDAYVRRWQEYLTEKNLLNANGRREAFDRDAWINDFVRRQEHLCQLTGVSTSVPLGLTSVDTVMVAYELSLMAVYFGLSWSEVMQTACVLYGATSNLTPLVATWFSAFYNPNLTSNNGLTDDEWYAFDAYGKKTGFFTRSAAAACVNHHGMDAQQLPRSVVTINDHHVLSVYRIYITERTKELLALVPRSGTQDVNYFTVKAANAQEAIRKIPLLTLDEVPVMVIDEVYRLLHDVRIQPTQRVTESPSRPLFPTNPNSWFQDLAAYFSTYGTFVNPPVIEVAVRKFLELRR
jgi:hypothetical protein